MKEVSRNYTNQYKLLFYLSWIILYFLFPSWRFDELYISFINSYMASPISPKIILLTYFFIAAYIMNYFFKTLFIEKPVIMHSNNWAMHVNNNKWLVYVCCIAVALHIYSFSPLHIISPHTVTDRMSLLIYKLITNHWHKLFNSSIQYPIWLFIIFLMLVATQKKLGNFISTYINSMHSAWRSSHLIWFLFMVGLFFLYTKLLPSYSSQDHLFITGEAPLGTVLYLSIYSLFGTTPPFLAPLIVQSIFYLLSSIYLYRTINLFCEKEQALLGSSIYLFSPIVFTYATLAHLQSGVLFFIIIVSFFFLRFIRDGNNRDLLLTTYFISIGSLYKRELILMFIICSAYLIINKIKNKDFHFINQSMVLSLSLISFLPWYFIGTRGADNTVLSHFTEINSLVSYLSMILSQISWPLFILLILSIIYAFLYKRDKLSLFFGVVFIAYYCLYTSLEQQTVHRYSMAFYPTISVFLAQLIFSLSQNIRWKHGYKVIYSVLIIYLVILCIIPRSSTKLITFKYTDFENQSFPYDKAYQWILNETRNNERVLVLIGGWIEYKRIEKEMPMNKILFYHFPELSDLFPAGDFKISRQNLIDLCKKQKISFIMFPGGDAITMYPLKTVREVEIKKFLEADRYNDFTLAAKYHIDDNYVYIYQLRENFIENQ